MEQDRLIPNRILVLESFQQDLRDLVNLRSETMLTLGEVANHPEGFSRERAVIFHERTGISVDEASSLMQTADYFYNRVTSEGISVDAAVQQIVEAALEVDAVVDDARRAALKQILSYKSEYEKGRMARHKSVETGPHYLGLDGSWNISIHKTREDEMVRSAVLRLSVVWHDEPGNRHEAYFQLTNDEWEEFRSQVDRLAAELSDIQQFLDE